MPTKKTAGDNWQLDFNYHDHGINCDLNLSGNATALAFGLKIAFAGIEDKVQALMRSGKPPASLMLDAMILGEVMKGDVREYQGEHLTIMRLKTKAKGLSTVMSLEWSD